MPRYIGKEMSRVDGVAKVTGKAKYAAEFRVPNLAYGFIVLGTISVFLNTAVDVVVTYAASAVRGRLAARPAIIRRMRQASGGILCALGATLALAKRPA